MKFDSHYLMSPSAMTKIQDKIEKNVRFVIYRGSEIFGKSLDYEFFIFKNDNSFKFVDGEYYEKVTFNYDISLKEKIKNTIFRPCYLHYKRIQYFKFDSGYMAKELYK